LKGIDVGLRSLALVALLPVALAACQTTGDPRQGGLFGWSEDKARARQAELERENDAAQRSAAQETQRQSTLTEKQGALRTEVQELQAQLSRLLAENDALESDVRALAAKRQVSTADLARMQQTLEANKRARAEARRVASQASTPRESGKLTQQMDVVRDYNQQLHREVLLLMGR
jgi:hypothetical protein